MICLCLHASLKPCKLLSFASVLSWHSSQLSFIYSWKICSMPFMASWSCIDTLACSPPSTTTVGAMLGSSVSTCWVSWCTSPFTTTTKVMALVSILSTGSSQEFGLPIASMALYNPPLNSDGLCWPKRSSNNDKGCKRHTAKESQVAFCKKAYGADLDFWIWSSILVAVTNAVTAYLMMQMLLDAPINYL